MINLNFLNFKQIINKLKVNHPILFCDVEKRKTSSSVSMILSSVAGENIDKELDNYWMPSIQYQGENIFNIVFSFNNIQIIEKHRIKFGIWNTKIASLLEKIVEKYNCDISSLRNFIFTSVRGGGENSQIHSALLSINHVLLKYLSSIFLSEEIKSLFKQHNLLHRDIRQEESKKYGLTKSRRPQQWSMR